ncbi:hypothetical protein [Bacillus sp. FJAT-49736]|uniref:hypothetical protein n=1 Tax=Bacillus sp. FJAT-49736 TaxID=2833582 RepID=UPI001BC911B7|nr:hypothetical protein [Bacillus sp. FJAT-49736]MBS4171671.1 hypothetical protein [Bacillus sp. FJAT-49736]
MGFYPCPPNNCSCPVNFVHNMGGSFSLLCGSEPFKIFESNIPTEMFISVQQNEIVNEDLCDLTVTFELEDGTSRMFVIPNPNSSAQSYESSGIQFYSDNVRRITLQCQGGEGGTRCNGYLQAQIFLRGSSTDPNCECPVYVRNPESGGFLPYVSTNFFLPCGSEEYTIFESAEPVEIIGSISLSEFASQNNDTCELEVTVELNDGSNLVFLVPNPNTSPSSSDSNIILFHTKETRRVNLQCLSGAGNGCRGGSTNTLVLRTGNN